MADKRKIAALTGAGISAESGISTFRDNGGLWARYDPQEVASIGGWRRNPSLMIDFYNSRRRELEFTEPNEAHKALAAMEKEFEVFVVTQNIDNLHEKAGSSNVLHLHGELTKVRPEDSYNDFDGWSEAQVVDIGYKDIHLGDKSESGAQIRPHIVWFGEAVPNIERAAEIVGSADALLIVGTSLSVYPAAGLYRYAKKGAPVLLVDPAEMLVRDERIRHIKAAATVGVKEAALELERHFKI